MAKKATRHDIARAHLLGARVESLRRDYLDMSEEFRTFLDTQFESENQFLNLISKIEITTDDIEKIAEESRDLTPDMDCCSLPADIF